MEETVVTLRGKARVPPMAQKQPGVFKSFFAGGAGGVSLVLTGHPLDTVKVRLQTQPSQMPGESPVFKGTLDCFIKTVRNEGVRGLYKGMQAPLLGSTPISAIGFFGYGLGKRLQQNNATESLTLVQYFNAGLLSGLLTSVVMTPGERIKCLMQIQMASKEKAKYKSSIDCARQLYREGGIRSVYRGIFATLLRDVPGFGIYFGCYEGMLHYLTPAGTRRDMVNPGHVLLAGGCAGVANWIYGIAPDTLKSRFQTAPPGRYTGVVHVFTDMVRTEGPLALFRGLTPVMLRAFPANAACFFGYEAGMKFLNWALPDW